MEYDLFWKTKLAAFLHDPPSKQFCLRDHEERAKAEMRSIGFSEEEMEAYGRLVKQADIWDSAGERFAFPQRECAHTFTDDPRFVHPLSGKPYPFESRNWGSLEEMIQEAILGVDSGASWEEKFFLYWRRWQENASSSGSKGAHSISFLPADSRIPDHSIWIHNAMTSAFAGCLSEEGIPQCEMLLFQFGPVQEFIAQARSTRDLFSGSYLLSWLMAHALQAVTKDVGPDSIVFPSLRGNGLFDSLHRTSFFARTWKTGNHVQTTWERICEEKGDSLADWLLTPTLPNRFLALVPMGEGKHLAQAAEASLQQELQRIGEAVWGWLETHGAAGHPDWKDRFFAQIRHFPQITWAVQPWLTREEALKACETLSPDVAKRLQGVLTFAEKTIPSEKKDGRYYTSGGELQCPSVLWSAMYALLNAKLAARRNTREFDPWQDPHSEGAVKDSLSGKEECIGDEAFWDALTTQTKLFSKAKGHRYGAMNLIKRLWCSVDEVPYVSEALGLSKKEVQEALRFRSLPELAGEDSYIAVLAIDGDQMGKWISGEKTLPLVDVLSPKAKEFVGGLSGGAELQRLLTPSYHLQFSEMLANFSIYRARSVVEGFDGELIYAGGDDVLAIVPAKRALACACAIREAFRIDFGENDGRMYPGHTCDVSCGISVGHIQAPLQMLVKEAQRMEHIAKEKYGRAALAIALYKRSGEIIEWGCKWDSPSIELMQEVTRLTTEGKLTGRFPYALASLLKPYELKGSMPEMLPVIRGEVRHVLERQGSEMRPEEREAFAKKIDAYGQTTEDRLEDFVNLFLAETFMNRERGNVR